MKSFKQAQKYGAKVLAPVAGLGLLVVGSAAHATGNPITDALTAVDLSTVATAVAAIALIIVAVALTFKGPDVAKRVIRKV